MKLMALDGNSLAYRAFFAVPTEMANTAGQVTNAVFGFTTMLITLMREHRPEGVIVVFDRKEPTFRHLAAPEYKAQRESQPDILYQQLDLIRELLQAMGIVAIDAAGFEGDDLIATIASRAEENGDDLIIVTGDRDNYQLVSDPHIRVLYNKRGVSDYALYDEAGIFARTGVTPAQYVDYSALRGDPSDNLDGVPGVGEKTAAKLIAKYQNLNNVFDHAQEQTPKLAQALQDNRLRVTRNAELMTLRRDAPVEIEIRQSTPRPNIDQVKQMFELFEFRTMYNRFVESIKHIVTIADQSDVGGPQVAPKKLMAKITTCASVELAVAALQGVKIADVAAAWTGEPGRSELYGLAFVTDCVKSEVLWIPAEIFLHKEVIAVVSGEFLFRGHNVKPLLRSLYQLGIEMRHLVLDTAIAAYLLDTISSDYEIGNLVVKYLGCELGSNPSQNDQGQLDFAAAATESSLVVNAANQALGVAAICQLIVEGLEKQNLIKLYVDIENPLVGVLAEMEVLGIGVDVQQLRNIDARLTAECLQLTKTLHQVAGQEFNLNSPLQLRKILYDEKKLSPGKKNKTGPSTDAATLEKLRSQWPEFIDPLLEYREVEKLRSTYGQGLLSVVGKDDRIHATFNQTVARTGRLSSDQPNLHNIPVRSEQGKVFRSAFVPRVGQRFLVADYNQIELRCIAHLAQDAGLIEAFNNNVDVHNLTAANVFGVRSDQVSSEQRSKAKMVAYGLAYGMEGYGLAQRLAISVGEANKILEAYFAAFPRVKKYMDETVEVARNRGYTETLFGRRRKINGLQDPNFRIRQMAERQAMNSGIQGLAADIFKVALVNLDRALVAGELASKMVLQVHDEVILEVPDSESDAVETIVRDTMCAAAKLAVPLVVNLAWGASWAAAKS